MGLRLVTTEKRMMNTIRILLCVSLMLVVALGIFIALYSNEYTQNKDRYISIYKTSLKNANSLISQTLTDDFDYETKYREITAELSVASEMLFLADVADSKVKCINELYYVFLKLPRQAKKYLSEISQGIAQITSGREEQGYAILNTVLKSVDKMDY